MTEASRKLPVPAWSAPRTPCLAKPLSAPTCGIKRWEPRVEGFMFEGISIQSRTVCLSPSLSPSSSLPLPLPLSHSLPPPPSLTSSPTPLSPSLYSLPPSFPNLPSPFQTVEDHATEQLHCLSFVGLGSFTVDLDALADAQDTAPPELFTILIFFSSPLPSSFCWHSL